MNFSFTFAKGLWQHTGFNVTQTCFLENLPNKLKATGDMLSFSVNKIMYSSLSTKMRE